MYLPLILSARSIQLLTREPDDRIGAKGGAAEIQQHPFFTTIDWRAVALRNISPPFKPPTAADDDDLTEHRGRAGDWMFSGDGRCWQTPSARGSVAAKDKELDSLFRDFTYSCRDETARNGTSPNGNGRRSSWSGRP